MTPWPVGTFPDTGEDGKRLYVYFSKNRCFYLTVPEIGFVVSVWSTRLAVICFMRAPAVSKGKIKYTKIKKRIVFDGFLTSTSELPP